MQPFDMNPAENVQCGEMTAAGLQNPGAERRGCSGTMARVVSEPLKITYPPELPVSERRDEIAAAIRDHQVVIVSGETGSGKTTQLPKICLELGRGRTGLIGHTQPRRIAARSVAARIAEELGTALGPPVGYKVRFTDQTARRPAHQADDRRHPARRDSQRDRQLRQYDTIIIDEAHERSLNIDFLLGYLKRLLPKRPDLQADHHLGHDRPRAVRRALRRPPRHPGPDHRGLGPDLPGRDPLPAAHRAAGRGRRGRAVVRDQTEAIVDAVAELSAAGPGDILVFLPGEREIRDTADAPASGTCATTEVLPLYARLSAAEQHRVFSPTGSRAPAASCSPPTSPRRR